jgi:uncharacterized membrane protein
MGLVFAIAVVQILVLAISAIIPFLPLLITGPLQAGCYYAFVRIVRGEAVEVRDMFDGFQEFGRSLGVYWLYSLALVVPGIILALGLMPAMYLVLDDRYGIGDTLQESWDMTRGYKWSIFVIGLVIFLLLVLGLLVFIVGAVFVAVYAYIIMATVYDELSGGRMETGADAG